MSSLGSPNPFFIAGKKAYEVERSLRFNNGDSPYLRRDPTSTSNRKTSTLSVWLKRTKLSTSNSVVIFSSNKTGSSTAQVQLGFESNNTFTLRARQNGTTNGAGTSTAVFRDPSAWYHIVYVLDTTQATNTNRFKLYVNGEQQTISYNSYPAQNGDLNMNLSGCAMQFGAVYYGGSNVSNRGAFYLAEVNWIDGQAYDPSYFAETNPATGQWNPKKYTGSYGTNGFYLNFSDNSSTSALGTDSSGNGNNFTPNNFSVSAGAGNDSLEDTPTNNFATMNPLVPSPTATWANGNLDLGGTSSTQYNQTNTSTFGVTSGKWYAEVKFTLGGTTNAYIGICPINAKANENMTNAITDAAVIRMDNTLFIEGSAPSAGTSISSGDIIGIALDMDNQKVWFSVQGTYVLSGNPSTGANATFDGITAGETIAICARPLNNTLNFNFGQRAFSYTPPTGFKTLCSANLPDPTILLPNKHFDTLLYTGNGSTQSISGLNFQPDWVWLKTRNANLYHLLTDSNRGVTHTLSSNSTDNESFASEDVLSSFDSDGFTLTADDGSGYYGWNRNSDSMVAWNWNAGNTDGKTYAVTVVSDSGNKYRFDGFGTSAVTLDLAEGGTYIFNYPSAHPFRFSTTSDGTHGGGTEYTTGVTVISSTSIQIVVAASAPTLYYYCSSHSGMGGAINTNSTLGSSNFDGTIQSVVKANTTSGFSIVTYTGNSTDGATVGHGLGVEPSAVIIKSRNLGTIGSAGAHWSVSHQGITGGLNGGSSAKRVFLSLTNAESANAHGAVSAASSTVVTFKDGTGNSDDAHVNNSSGNYVAYFFSDVAGYSKFGSYVGNGSTDGTFVFCGFKPALVILKKTNASDNWDIFDNKRDIDNPMHHRLQPNLSNAESTTLSSSQDQIDFLSNGFKLRSTSNNHNGNNSDNIFLAFSELPFKNARAR